tara:strand:+ start:868 stop:1089 length:222 start_codon:yes stop_codon:yes gene_type:complete
MAEKRIVYMNPDTGILAVVIPVYNDGGRPDGDTEEALLQRILATFPEGLEYHIVSEEEILEDRTFRGAWEWED